MRKNKTKYLNFETETPSYEIGLADVIGAGIAIWFALMVFMIMDILAQ